MFPVRNLLRNASAAVIVLSLIVPKASAQSRLCGHYETANVSSGLYSIENNAWGADDSGSQCTTPTEDQDGLGFSTTWVWGANETYASQTQVRSYPNIKLNSPMLPAVVSEITALKISAEWTMYPSEGGNKSIFDIDGLNSIGAKAAVNLDFFLDPDIKQSMNVTRPKYEIMVWFAALDATNPIGYVKGIAGSTILNGRNYTLYVDTNKQTNAEVFSFVAPSYMTSIRQLDVLPLFRYLTEANRMAPSTYLGTAQFGTETFHTDGTNVKFEAKGLELVVQAPRSPLVEESAAAGMTSGWRWVLIQAAVGSMFLL